MAYADEFARPLLILLQWKGSGFASLRCLKDLIRLGVQSTQPFAAVSIGVQADPAIQQQGNAIFLCCMSADDAFPGRVRFLGAAQFFQVGPLDFSEPDSFFK